MEPYTIRVFLRFVGTAMIALGLALSVGFALFVALA